MNSSNSPPVESLPGYRLLERLGQGGYGEVWRAEAPGGLGKAIKFIFGRQDGARATRELKALERIREVRHPFLLSLERIEVIEGRMIVVTELADCSLRDRLMQCLDGGGGGVPRDELLRYMRETAEALDYLRDSHSLQHLDVKPENILLVAGHVKVADFGLVKSLDTGIAESIVGGMTPTYAGPEVFRGTPTGASDQYSLAVVYQELLTGALPFTGSTTAELTLQHLNDEPDLSSLSESDRFAVSRALAKSPESRFASCTELVNMLASGVATEISEPTSPRPTARSTSPSRVGNATQVFDMLDDTAWNGPTAPIQFEIGEPEPYQLRNLPPLDDHESAFAATPTLFIGIGGSSGRMLRMLRQRMSAELGVQGPLATMPFLLLDVDPESISLATHGNEKGAGLLPSETVSLPLKRPQQYRAKSEQLLGWLGRRWLYNIPRSGRTEGIRPLGRLALVDHARQALQRVRRAVNDATSPEAIAETEAATGLTFRSGAMRVYVLTSISGGAGSGMALDIAYAARAILERTSLSDTKVIGLMTYSTARDRERGELSRVNAYSALTELRHLASPEVAYPGELSCGLPPAQPEVAPFDATYLLDFGAGSNDPQCVTARTAIVDYLFFDSLTATQTRLDAYRDLAARCPDRVRSFRVEETLGPRGLADAELLRRHLLEQWLGEEIDADVSDSDIGATNPLVHGAVQFVSMHRIDTTGLFAVARTIDSDADKQMGSAVQTLVAAIGGWLAEKLNAPGARLHESSAAAEWLLDHLTCVERDLGAVKGEHKAVAMRAATLAVELRAAVSAMIARITAIAGELRKVIGKKMDQVHPGEPGLRALAPQLDAWLQSEYLHPSGGAARVLVDPRLLDGMMIAALEIARRLVLPTESESEGEPAGPLSQQFSKGIDPRAFGGDERRLAASTLPGRDTRQSSVTLVECEGISIQHLAAHFIDRRQDYAGFAERVHSRRDIDWKPLVAVGADATSNAGKCTRVAEATMLVEAHSLPSEIAPVPC